MSRTSHARFRSYRVILGCAMVLMLLLMAASPVYAGYSTRASASDRVLAQAGRPIERSDWTDYLPVALIAVLIVVVVDAIFITRVLRDRRK